MTSPDLKALRRELVDVYLPLTSCQMEMEVQAIKINDEPLRAVEALKACDKLIALHFESASENDVLEAFNLGRLVGELMVLTGQAHAEMKTVMEIYQQQVWTDLVTEKELQWIIDTFEETYSKLAQLASFAVRAEG